jgi:hypothetical protein
VQASTLDLYQRIPRWWETYLTHNDVEIRGVTLNGYWTAQPSYERTAGLVPVHHYRFDRVSLLAETYLRRYATHHPAPERVCAFTNGVGYRSDPDEIRALLRRLGIAERAWFSIGLDAIDATCLDAFGQTIPRPHEMVRRWLRDAPYRSHRWRPLDVDQLGPWTEGAPS